MSRFTGPRVKKLRGLGTDLPGLSRKSLSKRPYPPGEHGNRRRGKDSEYKKQLVEKQKLRFNYGVHERHLRKLMKEARASKVDTGQELLRLLEARLDNAIFRAGLAPTIPASRQLVNHGHFLVNGRKVDVASFRVSVGDIIEVRPKSRELELITETVKHPGVDRPAWLVVDTNKMSAKVESDPTAEAVPFPVDINLVIEFYSKRM